MRSKNLSRISSKRTRKQRSDMRFFTQELAIDLGTANTVIFKDGEVVLDEPSIIAYCLDCRQAFYLDKREGLIHYLTNNEVVKIKMSILT